MKSSIKQTNYFLSAFVVLVYLFTPSGCLPILASREIVYRPSPSDPYYLQQAYATDSGLLFLCGSVDNGLEGYDRVHRVYSLELRLEETLDPQRSNQVQVVQIDELAPLDEASGWQKSDEKYPKAVGFIYLSRVGFNADLSQALVYFEQYYYDQPIRGSYLLLTRQDGQWVVEYGYEWMTQSNLDPQYLTWNPAKEVSNCSTMSKALVGLWIILGGLFLTSLGLIEVVAWKTYPGCGSRLAVRAA